jgi:hypothetical protein
VNMIMIEKRGYESALSACPAPAAAFAAAAPAPTRPRPAASGYGLLAGATTPFQGTGLPVRGQLQTVQIGAVQQVNDVPTMFVQPHPGDRARRPPA